MAPCGKRLVPLCVCVLMFACGRPAGAAAPSSEQSAKLAAGLEPFLSLFHGEDKSFSVTARVELLGDRSGKPDKPDKKPQAVAVELNRFDDQSFTLSAEHPDYALRLERTADRTALVLPKHGVTFVGEGPVPAEVSLAPTGLMGRIVSDESAVNTYAGIAARLPARFAAATLIHLGNFQTDDGAAWTSPKLGAGTLLLTDNGLEVAGAKFTARLKRGPAPTRGGPGAAEKPPGPAAVKPVGLEAAGPPAGMRIVRVDRTELERLIVRATHRLLEVAAPGPGLSSPPEHEKQAPHGRLRWVEGQRLVTLWGTPEQIGAAHGQLLAPEARRCVDSTLYLVGLADTVRRGVWFPDEMRRAYARLSPHVPPEHKRELDALADAAGVPRDEARLANVFPELFHCSGFAVFGAASKDGKLYHGRVLDYMTEIGLQDCATLFVIEPRKDEFDGAPSAAHLRGPGRAAPRHAGRSRHAFANVGYAGFIGCVSGMNDQQISLGEMGGKGQGQWDGVPMSTLMRRALEECSTLEQVKTLWATSPRTCEYYYVFADGKGPDAVGVAARPESIEFVKPGQGHPLLGEGIPDAVVLSAGGRLRCLRDRVSENLGRIDAAKAQWLMTEPVAMKSNLHDALFVPQDLVLYVANADRKQPAASRPYVKYDLAAIVKSIDRER